MKECQKQGVELVLNLLKTTLKECNLYMGLMIDKKNFNDSKIVFLDKDEFAKGKNVGLAITLDEINKDMGKLEVESWNTKK